jgi:hypothetical protein
MNEVVLRILGGVRLGEPVTAGGLTLVPVFSTLAPGPEHVTLAEALESGSLVVTELDDVGHVPQLRARNTGEVGVLALDGEELSGAKQNRVLNTAVYFAPGADVVVPVSCVEQGRWHHASPRFADSGYLATHRVRHAARESVTENVRRSGAFLSDQGRVWAEVGRLQAQVGVASATHAMRDVYESRRDEIDALTAHVRPAPGQRGLLAMREETVIGMDLLARPEAYQRLHDRFVRSYALECLGCETSPGPSSLVEAKRFVASLGELSGTRHRAPGSGISHRFTAAGLVGDALTYRSAVLHAAFFATGPSATGSDGASLGSAAARRRRRER